MVAAATAPLPYPCVRAMPCCPVRVSALCLWHLGAAHARRSTGSWSLHQHPWQQRLHRAQR
eukprot:9583270-Alexandrium_andersonii.AAC.1